MQQMMQDYYMFHKGIQVFFKQSMYECTSKKLWIFTTLITVSTASIYRALMCAKPGVCALGG